MQAYDIAFISKANFFIPIQARLIPFDPETLYSTKILTISDECQIMFFYYRSFKIKSFLFLYIQTENWIGF